MDWIAWDETLDTGHAGLDAEHRELARLFNRLRDATDGEGKAACARLLDDIIEHSRTHFELEQQLMAQQRYPMAEQHTAEHEMLLRQAFEYRANFDLDTAAARSTLKNFPEVWLAYHILFSDKALAAFLARSGENPDAPRRADVGP